MNQEDLTTFFYTVLLLVGLWLSAFGRFDVLASVFALFLWLGETYYTFAQRWTGIIRRVKDKRFWRGI